MKKEEEQLQMLDAVTKVSGADPSRESLRPAASTRLGGAGRGWSKALKPEENKIPHDIIQEYLEKVLAHLAYLGWLDF